MNMVVRSVQAVAALASSDSDTALVVLCGKYVKALNGLQTTEKALAAAYEESWQQLPPPDPLIVYGNTEYLRDTTSFPSGIQVPADTNQERARNHHISQWDIRKWLKYERNRRRMGCLSCSDKAAGELRARMRQRLDLAKARDRAQCAAFDALGGRSLHGHLSAHKAHSARWHGLICASPAQTLMGAHAKLGAVNATRDLTVHMGEDDPFVYYPYRDLLDSFLNDMARLLPGRRDLIEARMRESA